MGGAGGMRKGLSVSVRLSLPGPADCPFCHTGTIHYDTIRATEDGMAYGFTCSGCGVEADERFDLVFRELMNVRPFSKNILRRK